MYLLILNDVDCTITVNDLADHFVPPAASGDAFLQSRLWPAGEAGTKGQGLYPYLYRIDLRNAVGITAAACVTSMRIEFGPIVPMDYNGDGNLEHAFVVTKDGTLLPVDLRASSGYPWDGDTGDVIDAINEGRFLVLHRDHGWTDGWGDPAFSTGDLASLANGALTPVVYSINCASGMFDNETLNPAAQAYPYSSAAGYVSWAEQLLRMQGGAAGIIGDTRVSPTWVNSALTRGLFDATWPSVLPAYGGAKSVNRLGDILNYGKMYMVGQVGVAQTAGSVTQSYANTDVVLYHVLGDPSMKMWTKNPWQIYFPEYYYEIEIPKPGEWKVKYPVEGAIMTALQDGNPIARAPITGGEAALNFIHDADPDLPIELSVQHPDGIGALLKGPDAHSRITPNSGGMVEDNASLFLPAIATP